MKPSLRRSPTLGLTLASVLLAATASHAEEAIDFNHDIRPILSSRCWVCHGPDENERAADLRLDTEDGSREDLGGYAAIVPGDPETSELFLRMTTDDEDIRMPPEGEGLNEAEIDLIRRWIKQGATYARHWSYENPVRPALPKVALKDWPRNAIDHFVLARLEREHLHPSPEADRLTLARRAAIDLTGLPPTWEEAQQLLTDPSENAYELYVDRLLAKQTFGERWARVWLDLARYADSAGYADDPLRTIWAYRDYVIRSLNENKPFDQFTIEQIAGDLLENPSEDQLIATGFHRNTLTNSEGGTNDEEFRNVAIVDRVNTTMAVWMGTTMACAQCHSHKYDPITQEEYFRFFAFFNHTEDTDKKDERPYIEIWTEDQEARKADLNHRIAQLQDTLNRPTPELESAQQQWLAEVRVEPTWTALVPDSAKARSRALSNDEQGWVSASGDDPNQDRYTLRYKTGDSELTALKLEVPAEQQRNFVLSNVNATWKPAGKKSIDARYVRVDLPGKGKMIHLAEMQIFSGGENVALAGKASQSSTDFGGKVSFVNDGNTDGNYNNRSVTHTAVESNPWLEIDLGASKPIDSVALWNRTDGGDSIRDRLKGFKLTLLSEQRDELWQVTPPDVPKPNASYSPGGAIQLNFRAALADHEQDGFPAASVIAAKANPKKGWAIGNKSGESHELTLILGKPIQLSAGTLTIGLNHASVHKKHLLDRFRFSMTSDASAAEWAKMSSEIRQIIRTPDTEQTDDQRGKLASFYRSITPLLNPQRRELDRLQRDLAAMRPYTTTPVMRQLPSDKHRTTKIQIRGNYLSTGETVSEGVPATFHPLPSDSDPDRLDLARWLVDDANPLTPRVVANRHWEEIFGNGIVQTSEEFGSQGDLPSHPLLLDWLAVDLRESGWDLKRLLKLIVTSATYRQSSKCSADLLAADPSNRLYSRGPRFRISAEMVRDQALFVSGLLSGKMFGKPVNPPQPELGLKAAFGSATDWKTSSGDDRYRRGIYTAWRRSSPYPSMAQFDAPNREVCTVRRIRTNTPLQALVTMNDPVYVEAAQSLARNMISSGETPEQRIRFAFHQCLVREPSDLELTKLTELAVTAQDRYTSQPELAKQMATDPLGDLPEGADVAEYAAWTVVGNVILNLDEMFMKR